MFAVIYLAKFAACHDSQHFKAAKRVFRYLVTTVDYKLTYHQQPKSDLLKCQDHHYSDADWAVTFYAVLGGVQIGHLSRNAQHEWRRIPWSYTLE